MKGASSIITIFFQEKGVRRNVNLFTSFVLFMIGIIALYSVLFHVIMIYEGQDHSWITGLYWTLTVMSTLGFGDITFHSDLGRLFSILVLLTGVICLLVMLPFVFIQFIYTPWVEAQKKKQVPRAVSPHLSDHILLVGDNPIADSLAEDLALYGHSTVFITSDDKITLDLLDRGFQAMEGGYNSPDTYRAARFEHAAMLVTLGGDIHNTNAIFAARQVDSRVAIFTRAEDDDAIDVLMLAGASRVFQFRKLLGQALAKRVITGQNRVSFLAGFGQLEVGEALISGTDLVGQTLIQSNLRQKYGLNVVGIREQGKFVTPTAQTVLGEKSVLILAGSHEQLQAFGLEIGGWRGQNGPVIILGGGRVGKAAARSLAAQQVPLVIVDKIDIGALDENIRFIQGDASDLSILQEAGINTATSAIVTTHDDDTNIYLTIYCRRLRPDMQIVSRATLQRNVATLQAAGADLVLSLSSMVSSNILNLLSPGQVFLLNEDLNLFRVQSAQRLTGKTVQSSEIRAKTGCNVVAVKRGQDEMTVNPPPDFEFQWDDSIYLIGDSKAEAFFYEHFGLEKHNDLAPPHETKPGSGQK